MLKNSIYSMAGHIYRNTPKIFVIFIWNTFSVILFLDLLKKIWKIIKIYAPCILDISIVEDEASIALLPGETATVRRYSPTSLCCKLVNVKL